MIVEITPEAEADVLRLVSWLSERSPSAARAATIQLLEGMALLGEHFYAGRAAGADVREKVVGFGRDGFVLTYEVQAEMVLIQRVFHGRQAR